MTSELPILRPQWPAPPNVRAGCTTRLGGVSAAPWDSLNLGRHVADRLQHVEENRERLARAVGIGADRFYWLEQVHGAEVVSLPAPGIPRADASMTRQQEVVCTILTADCLSVLFCDRKGSRVAAAHAGWRGLCDGVLEGTVRALGCPPGELMAWLGPAIGPGAFEVGREVRDAFVSRDPGAVSAFRSACGRDGHFLADIYALARQRLNQVGVVEIFGGDRCTVSDAQRFYSYRRDGVTGRMASFIWLS